MKIPAVLPGWRGMAAQRLCWRPAQGLPGGCHCCRGSAEGEHAVAEVSRARLHAGAGDWLSSGPRKQVRDTGQLGQRGAGRTAKRPRPALPPARNKLFQAEQSSKKDGCKRQAEQHRREHPRQSSAGEQMQISLDRSSCSRQASAAPSIHALRKVRGEVRVTW